MQHSYEQIIRKQEAHDRDIEFLRRMLDHNQFDWNKRYDNKYIVDVANDFNLNKSRFKKAIDTLDRMERILNNKIIAQENKDDPK